MEEKIYTSETAAALLQCNPQTIQRLCHSGKLKGYKTLRKWYVLHSDLLEFIKSEKDF